MGPYFHSGVLLYTLGPYSLSCIAITLLPLWCIAIYTGTLFHCAVLPYTYMVHVPYFHSAVLLYTLRPYSTLLHFYRILLHYHIHGTLFTLWCIAIYTTTLSHSAALPYTWYSTLFPLCCIAIYTTTLFHFAAFL